MRRLGVIQGLAWSTPGFLRPFLPWILLFLYNKLLIKVIVLTECKKLHVNVIVLTVGFEPTPTYVEENLSLPP